MFTARFESYLVKGTDFKNLSSARQVLKPDRASDFDNGETWIRRGQILKGAKPKEWKAYTDPPPGHTARGAGLPGAGVDPAGRYAFVYYTDQSMQEKRGTQICMARASPIRST